jgi:aryl-alcohol dehydrogenase-like predicted oxidoreductase
VAQAEWQTRQGHHRHKSRAGDGSARKALSKAYILRAAEDSLGRLETDYIDLYQSHRDDPETPLDETLQAYAQLMEQGKVRAIGASNYRAERLSYALALSRRHECLQTEYNLYDRAEYEETLEPVCIENGLGVLSYFSLGSGFLTGKYKASCLQVAFWGSTREASRRLKAQRLAVPRNERRR